MLILAVDTATTVNTIALVRDGITLAQVCVNAPKRHAERLVAMTDALLAESEIPLSEVDLFAVSAGPGSFTGLRIGVATWKGFALGCGKPLIAVPTLDALARSCGIHNGVLAVLVDAKMHEIYGSVYRFSDGQRGTLVPVMVGPVETLLDAAGEVDFFAGDGATVYRERILARRPEARFVAELHNHPRAAAVAAEAWELWQAGDSGDAGAVHPLYLRQSQPEELRKQAQVAGAGTP